MHIISSSIPSIKTQTLTRNASITRLQILSLLQDGGAERSNYFSDFVTHLIAGHDALESDISEAKDLNEIPAVTQDWILYSVKCNKLLPYPIMLSILRSNDVLSIYLFISIFIFSTVSLHIS